MTEPLDLDAQREWIAAASKPVAQGSGALWSMMDRRDLAVGVANRLLAEVARLRSLNTMLGANVDAMEAENARLRARMDSHLEPLPTDSPWFRDHKFLANTAYEMANRIGELTAERDTLTARLAEAEKVIEAAEAWRNHRLDSDAIHAVLTAVDAYRQSTRAEDSDGTS